MKVVKMDRVIMNVLSAHQKVPDDPRVVRDRDRSGILNAPDRRHAVDIGTNAASALGEQPGVFGQPVLENNLYAAEKRPAAPSVADNAVGNLDFDF
jgi:hypothetical protein